MSLSLPLRMRYVNLVVRQKRNCFSAFGSSAIADLFSSRQQLKIGRQPLIPCINRLENGFKKVEGISNVARCWLTKLGGYSIASRCTQAIASDTKHLCTSDANVKKESTVSSADQVQKEINNPSTQQQGTPSNEGKSGKPKKPAKPAKAAKLVDGLKTVSGTGNAVNNDAVQPADIRRIELRIGRIVDVYKHPEADSLYVERVDVGDPNGRLRTVVSGLVRHVQQEELRGRLAIFITNIKPVKLRGIFSEAMILCATSSESSEVEVLAVPQDCQPGDRIFATGFEDGEPDVELNLRRGVWADFVKPALRTNATGVACFRDSPLRVRNRNGLISSKVKNAQIS